MNIGRAVRAGRVNKKKGQDRKKWQKGYISPIWGEAPTEAIYIKNCVVSDVLDVITCAEFQNEIFMGYRGSNLPFSYIDFGMGLTIVQRYCAAKFLFMGYRGSHFRLFRAAKRDTQQRQTIILSDMLNGGPGIFHHIATCLVNIFSTQKTTYLRWCHRLQCRLFL